MGRLATLTPTFQKSKKLWLLSLPARLSKTGKRSQEYFTTKKEAERRSQELKKFEKENQGLAMKASSELIRDAVELDELAKIYGFSGLREAFMTWGAKHERQNSSLSFEELLNAHEADGVENWSDGYLSARWKPFRRKVEGLSAISIALMDTDYWRDWLVGWRKKVKPAPATYNQTLSLLKTVFGHEKARKVHPQNPIDSIPKLKSVKSEVCISTTEEVKALLEWCWNHDRELIPYFVFGYFAGMRPQSEIEPMTFEQINFDERIIDCVTTKTRSNPRRQLAIEDNAMRWLSPFEGERGSIIPSNFVKRYGKARKAAGVTWGHDVMRHSYGSYFEAKNRGEAGCRDQLVYNMGHSTFKTYEQNYRNGKVTPKQAAKFWALVPPKG